MTPKLEKSGKEYRLVADGFNGQITPKEDGGWYWSLRHAARRYGGEASTLDAARSTLLTTVAKIEGGANRRVTRHTMWPILLNAVPAFQAKRDAFLAQHKPDGEPLPEFICTRDLAEFTVEVFAKSDAETVEKVMEVVEIWLTQGDDDVADLASTGFLEDLGNWALHETTTPDDFEQFMSEDMRQEYRAIQEAWASLIDKQE